MSINDYISLGQIVVTVLLALYTARQAVVTARLESEVHQINARFDQRTRRLELMLEIARQLHKSAFQKIDVSLVDKTNPTVVREEMSRLAEEASMLMELIALGSVEKDPMLTQLGIHFYKAINHEKGINLGEPAPDLGDTYREFVQRLYELQGNAAMTAQARH